MLGLNGVEILDISVAIRPGMVTYPGDPTVRLERISALANGAAANISRLDFGVHTGTHVDAPAHFIDGAPAAETLPLQVLVGPDYLSLGDEDAHRALLGAGIVAVEGLDLRDVDPGEYQLVCAPLKLVGADGAPARALL